MGCDKLAVEAAKGQSLMVDQIFEKLNLFGLYSPPLAA